MPAYAPLQKVSTNPYFNSTSFPPFSSLSTVGAQSRAEGMRLVLVSSGVALRTDCLLTPLCKKCRQTPILILQVFPHFSSLSTVGAQSRTEGVRLTFGQLGCGPQDGLPAYTPVQKVSANPYFNSTSSPPTFSVPQSALRAVVRV